MTVLFLVISFWPSTSSSVTVPTTGGRVRSRASQSSEVEAWWNPSSGRWESPAPWDPLFVQHKHSLRKVCGGT